MYKLVRSLLVRRESCAEGVAVIGWDEPGGNKAFGGRRLWGKPLRGFKTLDLNRGSVQQA